jgi:DNA-binding MarR family transcriptional regulator
MGWGALAADGSASALRPAAADRRSSILALTPAGKRLLPKITATVDDELGARLGSVVSGRSLTELIGTLSGLRAGISAADAAAELA